MKLSTRSRYGLRLLVDLSQQGDKVVPLAEIAERQKVSANYMELVVKDLKRAGFISAIKGPKGGYSLAVAPDRMNVGDVLRLLEGDVRLTNPPSKAESALQKCVRENVFDAVNHKVAMYFDGLYLSDIIKQNTI